MRWFRTGLLALLCLASLAAVHSPWRARRRPEMPLPNRLADQRVGVSDWEPEPATPKEIDPGKLARAFGKLCGIPGVVRARALSDAAIAAGKDFEVDPFMLGALAYTGSSCRPSFETPLGIGLTSLPPQMYQDGFHRGLYRYQVRQAGAWIERTLSFSRFGFNPAQLKRAEPNLYFAAGMIAMWRSQHASIDEAFEQVPHRDVISHFVWGDRVKSARDEDRILTERRRLLGYYGALPPRAPLHFRGVELGPPLDGAPRVVSSGLGFVRDGGERSHRGIDVEADFGEPVRAIADGLVVFSGVDLPGQREHVQLRVEETNGYSRRALGHGGRYICIQHAAGSATPLRSCYMHLERVEVAYGDHVKRGDGIGIVGRTGMKSSPPHLHLELMALDELLDPLPALRGHLIGTPIDFEGAD